MTLPGGQKKVWNTLVRQYRLSGQVPLPVELAKLLRLHLTTVLQHLRALEHKGLVTMASRGQGRSVDLSITPGGKLEAGLGIPLLGSIRAGPLSLSTQEPKGLLRLPGKPGFFGLEVMGDSMAPRFEENDVVIVQATEYAGLPQSSQVAAVRLHDETTLKQVFPRGSTLMLKSLNRRYKPIEVSADEAVIQGVYWGHIGGSLAQELLEVIV